jgi:stress-induced morphogen
LIWQKRIQDKLVSEFSPLHLECLNESPQHGLPESAEKHFRVVVVSSKMEGVSRIDRHRLVNDLLAQELREHVHALSVQAFTPSEWEKKQGATFASPACLGGGKKEGIS